MRLLCVTIVTLSCIQANGQGVPGVEYGDPLPLYYDTATGNATVDLTNVFGGATAGYTLAVPCDEPCDAFRPENHTPFMGTIWVEARTRSIGESNFNNVPGGVYSLGNIFPVGLSEQEIVETYFTPEPRFDRVAYFVIGPLGSGMAHAFQPIYTPSPFPPLNDAGIGPSILVDQWAIEAVLRYNALTGDLSVDTTGPNGGAIFTYDIQLTEALFSPEQFTPAHAEGLGAAKLRADQIIEASWEGIQAGNHVLGSILPTDLSEAELLTIIDYARFLGEPGHDVASFDIQASGIDMTLQHIVPEPGSGLLASLIAFVLTIALRRRAEPS